MLISSIPFWGNKNVTPMRTLDLVHHLVLIPIFLIIPLLSFLLSLTGTMQAYESMHFKSKGSLVEVIPLIIFPSKQSLVKTWRLGCHHVSY